MTKKKLFDHDRQEEQPPRVEMPFEILRSENGRFSLVKHTGTAKPRTLKHLEAYSEDGAHREARLFLIGYNSR